jgi:hypothetical protein
MATRGLGDLRGSAGGTRVAVSRIVTTTVRSYDYVNHGYTAVRDALRSDPLGIFQRATTVAARRAGELGAQLHARVGPIDIAADVAIEVTSIVEVAQSSPASQPATRLELSWRAVRRPGMFPVMHAVLSIYPLTSRETQLELEGTYDPPAGVVGRAFDAVAGHRIAEASVQKFVQEVAAGLREELARPARG